MALMTDAPTCVWDVGAILGEGPVWSQDRIWFVDILAPLIHCFDPVSGERQSWPAPDRIGFILPTVDGDFVVGLKSGLYRFTPETGTFVSLAKVEPDALDNRLNDAAVGADGYLWFGSMHDPETSASGALYRLDSDGRPRARDTNYIVTNGPAFSPDGRTLYHTDTLGQLIYAFDLGADGVVSGKRVFVRIDEPGMYPDGPVVDVEGCVWTGLFGGWEMRRYAPSGELLRSIRLPCSRVTKGAFGGPEGKTLYMTTARKGLSPEALANEPLAGGLFAVTLDIPGPVSPPVRHGLKSGTSA